jgi:hypothetical protein
MFSAVKLQMYHKEELAPSSITACNDKVSVLISKADTEKARLKLSTGLKVIPRCV